MMYTIFEHLLKSAGVLCLFLMTYHLFLRKETFFQKNRWFLFFGALMALVLPFVRITKTVFIELTAAQGTMGTGSTMTTSPQILSITLVDVLLYIYGIGVVALSVRLLLQILRIRAIKNNGHISEQEGFYHVRTTSQIDPFSFFRYIFYFPNQFKAEELQAVIAHEKIHARELHSLDILLVECITILQWFNPLAWYYKWTIKQNLEFLADAKTCQEIKNRKFYQYLMLKHATGTPGMAIANPFFNQIIKKRIVMMNKNQSKQMNSLKSLFILPFLALFLWSFNTETVYEFGHSSSSITKIEGKSIELIIDKNTTDGELEKIKKDLAEDGIDFSYTVVHNDVDEIIDISIQVSGKGENGGKFNNSYNSSDNKDGISPIVIFIDLENNLVSVGSKGSHSSNQLKMNSKSNSFWVSSDDGGKEVIEIRKSGEGTEVITLNGETITREELKEKGRAEGIMVKMLDVGDSIEGHITINEIEVDQDDEKKKIINIHGDQDGHENVFIVKDSNHEDDIEVIGGNGFFFIDTDGKEKPLYYIDGKKASEKEVKALSPDDIESIEVRKGDSALKKYGKKARNGVIEITTKD